MKTDWLHKRVKTIFETDIGIVFGVILSLIWLVDQIITRRPIDFLSVISLLGFLMIFFIERSHGREMKAVHLKLDELLAANEDASNKLIRVEEAPEHVVHKAHNALHELAQQTEDGTLSVDRTESLDSERL